MLLTINLPHRTASNCPSSVAPCSGATTTKTSTTASATSTSTAGYLGCYTDSASSRTLGSYTTTSSTMTNPMCIQTCSGLGYAYAGTGKPNPKVSSVIAWLMHFFPYIKNTAMSAGAATACRRTYLTRRRRIVTELVLGTQRPCAEAPTSSRSTRVRERHWFSRSRWRMKQETGRMDVRIGC